MADIFTIEAFAADISELQKVVNKVPDEEDWDLYIDTSVLEAYYKSAKLAIAMSAFYSQADVDQLAKDLQNAIDNLKLHTQSISISSSALSLEIGKTATLIVTLNPENAADEVRWTSNNSSYVSVEKINEHEAKITVHKYIRSNVTISAVSNGKTAVCNVTVLNPLESVKLSKDSLSLFENQSESLIATALGTDSSASPTGDVFYSWSTSKASVASVTDDGEVFAVAPGTATITVTASDGKGKTAKATCKVTVEEDVAFGPENLGIASPMIRKRVDAALKQVGMYHYREHAPHLLSGGQKQRVAIAGIIAMEPKCIVLDEPTAMLDPKGRREVMETILKLNREKGITVVLITHHMDEAAQAQRVIVLSKGQVAADGTPREVFSRVELLHSIRLAAPDTVELCYELNKHGFQLPLERLDAEECAQALYAALKA